MERTAWSVLLVGALLIAAPRFADRAVDASWRASPEAERRGPARSPGGSPVSTLTVLGRLRELAHAGGVQIVSTEALPGERAVAGGPAERALKLTATGAEPDLLRYAELVAGCTMPVRVESVELLEVDVARTPTLRLELRVIATN